MSFHEVDIAGSSHFCRPRGELWFNPGAFEILDLIGDTSLSSANSIDRRTILKLGTAMFAFGGIMLALSFAGGSRIRRATANPEGRAIEEREKRTGLEE